jgi:hypothetical protein
VLLLFLDDGKGNQVIGGLCEEATQRMARRGGAWYPPPEEWGLKDEALIEKYRKRGLIYGHGPHAVRYGVVYDAEEMKFAFEGMAQEAGVRLLYGAMACDPIVDGDRLAGVVFQAKDGRFAITADVVIDTTGDGDVFWAAGCAYESEKVAPWLWFTAGGVAGEADARDAGSRFFSLLRPGNVLLPWGATPRISRTIDATNPEDITFAATASRKLVMEEFDRLRAESPEFRDAYLGHVADQLDVTESRRLAGEYVLGREDMDRPLDDVIAVTGHWTKYESVYHIPYRSLLPREFRNLLTAGRCISVDHRTHHATKEIPACMATGEAAGVAAALACGLGGDVKAVEVRALQRRLEAHGAILYPYGRPVT